jgi:hypothetical protein
MTKTASVVDGRYRHQLRREARGFRVDLERKQWCDLWHHHFDMDGHGNGSWRLRRLHVSALMQAMSRARLELHRQGRLHQLFAYIDAEDAGQDALYVHTENPNGTAFPCELTGRDLRAVPPLLAGQVNLDRYRVLAAEDGRTYYVFPR